MVKVIVYHRYAGCDTGCCGHVVEMQDDDGNEQGREFEFTHPYGDDPRRFAEDLIRERFGDEHVADLDWENCQISND